MRSKPADAYAALMKKEAPAQSGSFWKVVALGGSALLLGIALDRLSGRSGKRREESRLDEALDETFPASDATATQDFSAPEDRAGSTH